MKNVTANEHEFSVFDEGTGAPILFVHGFPLNHTMWQGQLDEFANGYRVIAPDLRGFGQSGARFVEICVVGPSSGNGRVPCGIKENRQSNNFRSFR